MQKHMLKEQFRLELEDKMRHLEEDRNSTSSDSCLDALQNLKKRKRYSQAPENCFLKELPDRRKKPVTLSGPYVVYMLHEAEIMEDYDLIKKATITRRLDSSF